MYLLFWQLSTGERRFLGYEFATEEQALTARWNWGQRGELYWVLTPTGDTL